MKKNRRNHLAKLRRRTQKLRIKTQKLRMAEPLSTDLPKISVESPDPLMEMITTPAEEDCQDEKEKPKVGIWQKIKNLI